MTLDPTDIDPTDIEACLDAVHGPDVAEALASVLGPAIALHLALEVANLRAHVARLTSRVEASS